MNRLFLLVLLLMTAPTMSAQEAHFDSEHAQWIASVIDSIHTIKPGMTRADVLRVFTTEGGLSNRRHRTYVYKECPYIKVTVEFKPVGDPNNLVTEMPTDRVVSISAPFLQYSVGD